jgi:hypothetical protein
MTPDDLVASGKAISNFDFASIAQDFVTTSPKCLFVYVGQLSRYVAERITGRTYMRKSPQSMCVC